LFPFKLQEVRSECSCPDKANPCKHISAVYFLMGERFSEDPFVLFQLRGRTRAKLLDDLADYRRKALKARAEAAAETETTDSPPANNQAEGQDQPTPPHPAVLDPTLWWRYDASLDSDLVVITPAMEGDTGLDAAGELPLAEEPKFPDAKQQFLQHLRDQGQALGQQAMLAAMTAGGG
jgi:uncharacterized Zn finger protein